MRTGQRSQMFFVGMLAVIGAANQASAVPLSYLLWEPYRGVQVGGLLCDNFSLTVDGVGLFVINPSAIEICGAAVGGDFGIRIAGPMAALSSRTPNSSMTIVIGYDVALSYDLGPLLGIWGLAMNFNGVSTTADGIARVDEVVTKIPGGEVVAAAHVNTHNPPTSLNFNFFEFPADEPRPSKLHVDTTITLDGGKAGTATISFINQAFAEPLIPEPAMVGLFALALPLMLRRNRRR